MVFNPGYTYPRGYATHVKEYAKISYGGTLNKENIFIRAEYNLFNLYLI
jgi:hypothetical protein